MLAKNLNLSNSRLNAIVFIFLVLFILVGTGVDLMTPSLPAISKSFHTSPSFPQALISIYLLGYALICIFIGFLSDSWGRRKLLITSLVMYVIGSILPIIFPDETALLLGRLLQGMGVGAMSTLAQTIVSDLFPKDRVMSVGAKIATLWSIGSISGPFIGGYLQYYFNWLASFYFFTVFSLIILIVVALIVPESLPNRQTLQLKQITSNFKAVLGDSFFMGLLIVGGLAYSVLIVFSTMGPFFIQKNLGYTPIFFGHVALGVGLVFLAGTLSSGRLVKKFKAESLIGFAAVVSLVIAVALLILSYINGSTPWILIIATGVLFLVNGIAYPALYGRAMTVFQHKPHLSGTANSMLILSTTLITALVAGLMSLVHQTSAVSISWVFIVLTVLRCIAYYGMVAKKRKQEPSIVSN